MSNHPRRQPIAIHTRITWFRAADGQRHAIDSHLTPGRGDMVRTLCAHNLAVTGRALTSTRCPNCAALARSHAA